MGRKRPRRRRAMLLALPSLLSLFLAAGLLLGPNPGRAQAPTSLGVDLVSDGNGDAFVGSVQSCLEVDVGDSFPVDIFIKDAQGLRAWELRFAFDHDLLQIVDRDFDQFLLSTDPSGAIFPSLFEMETADRYFLAAAEFRGTPDSGSGVLARLSMQAIAPGRSPVTIATEPRFLSPHLTDSNGSAIFEGAASQGEVAVGEPCSPSHPKPDPPPSSDDSPGPGDDDGPISSPPADDDGPVSSPPADDDGPISSPPALVSLSDSPPHTPSGVGPTQALEASDASLDSAASDEAAEGEAAEGSSEVGTPPEAQGGAEAPDAQGGAEAPDAPVDDSAPDQEGAAPSGDEGFSGFGWQQTILVLAVVALGAGGGLLAFSLRRRS